MCAGGVSNWGDVGATVGVLVGPAVGDTVGLGLGGAVGESVGRGVVGLDEGFAVAEGCGAWEEGALGRLVGFVLSPDPSLAGFWDGLHSGTCVGSISN